MFERRHMIAARVEGRGYCTAGMNAAPCMHGRSTRCPGAIILRSVKPDQHRLGLP